MNIIFEGVDASGKTTTMNSFSQVLDYNEEKYHMINELEESPLSPVLQKMFESDPFLISNKHFKTSAYESLVLAASHFYKQEFMRDEKQIVVYDRDFLTILAYQKPILEKEYGRDYIKFYEPYKQLLLYDLKPIELLVYLQVPLEVSIQRIISRGREKPYTKEQIDFLKRIKDVYEKELIPEMKDLGMNILTLDGREDPTKNAQTIYRLVKR